MTMQILAILALLAWAAATAITLGGLHSSIPLRLALAIIVGFSITAALAVVVTSAIALITIALGFSL